MLKSHTVGISSNPSRLRWVLLNFLFSSPFLFFNLLDLLLTPTSLFYFIFYKENSSFFLIIFFFYFLFYILAIYFNFLQYFHLRIINLYFLLFLKSENFTSTFSLIFIHLYINLFLFLCSLFFLILIIG